MIKDFGDFLTSDNLIHAVDFYSVNFFEFNDALQNKLSKYFMGLLYEKIQSKAKNEDLNNIIKIILIINDIFKEQKYSKYNEKKIDFENITLMLTEKIESMKYNNFIQYKITDIDIKKNLIAKANIPFKYLGDTIIHNKKQMSKIILNHNLGIGKIFSTKNAIESFISNKMEPNKNIIIIYKNGYVELKYDEIETETKQRFFNENDKLRSNPVYICKIKEIYVNGLLCIKNADIKEPFKYLSPLGCLNLVTKKNNVFTVHYFINNDNENSNNHIDRKNSPIDKGLLEHNNETFKDDKIVSIKINPVNLLFPNKSDFDTNIFNNICLKYGVNNFNWIFVRYSDSRHGFYYNEKNKDIFHNLNNIHNVSKNSVNPDINSINKLFELKQIDRTKENTGNLNNNMKKLIDTIPKININLSSLNKLLLNISSCDFDKKAIKIILEKFIKENNKFMDEYFSFMSDCFYKNVNISHLFVDEKNNIIKYFNKLLLINKVNEINNIIDNIKVEELCSHIKIMTNMMNFRIKQFTYNFEIFFEFLIGSYVNEEQYSKYTDILQHYKEYKINSELNIEKTILNIETNYNSSLDINKVFNYYSNDKQQKIYMKGGGKKYPLYHFMMGKGKSAIITPLLMLYFALIHNKIVYIIVPEHLKNQTIKEVEMINVIFKIENNVFICTDSEIKLMHLNDTINKESVMIIDEFDTILNPLTSNYNITKQKEISTKIIYDFINNNMFEHNEKYSINKDIDDLLMKDIKNISDNIKNNKLKENVNWGIHPDKCYAIPYASKDTPMLNSNFSSPVLTVFLTFYYYIVIKKYASTNYIINFIIRNNLVEKIEEEIFGTKIQLMTDDVFNSLSDEQRKDFYRNILLKHIFNYLLLPSEQFNTSFVDIINIDNIFKIGYSGTLNIDIPENLSNLDQFKEIHIDNDEKTNVYYALINANLIKNTNIFDILKEKDYDALIDESGEFKNDNNYYIANEIYKKIQRPIIYVDNYDNILTIDKNGINEKYDPSIKYEKPFFYYDQKHIVGTDIKQDFYPILKGLCILDNNSTYTSVAQAIFRLRKINMGHSIDLLMSNFTTSDIINKLIKNDENEKKAKQKHMKFQIIKSNIRKLRK